MSPPEKDRRRQQRFRVEVPMVILGSRAMLGGGTGLTHNISVAGIFFHTECSLPVGLKFQFKAVMPAEITGTEKQRATCRARVARLEEYPERAEVGVAAVIESVSWV